MEKGLISVDLWKDGSQLYFLTHLHSDHTQGLTSVWSRGPLFCSKHTAKLFPVKFPGFNLSLLRVLDIGVWHSLPLVSPSSGSRTLVRVMAIDANHCPGAVMFLFRGDFGWSLFTGDFRWETDNERSKRGRDMLRNALGDDSVDILYLDNTYCNPSYDFPPRRVAAQKIIDIIASHPEHDIVIGIDTLGKEDLLLHISKFFNVKIWVWPERLQTMHCLGFHDMFTTKTSLTRIRAIPRYSFSIETLEGLNNTRPTIGIMPSGLPWVVRPRKGDDNLFGSHSTSFYRKGKWGGNRGTPAEKLDGNKYIERFHRYIYSVPYSAHSCFAEIQEFIELVQPTTMKGIVSSSSCYVDPLYYFGRLCASNQTSQRLCLKNDGKEKGKSHAAVQVEYCIATRSEKKKKQKFSMDYVGLSRVTALRRVRRGAKIMVNDCSD